MANANFGFSAEYRFFEFKIDILAQIGSPLRTGALAGTAAKNVANAEYVSEDVAEILESSPAKAVASYSGMTEAIIRRSLFAVAENRVGFTCLFEPLLGVGVVGIAVGMILQSELAISALNFLFG
jgi:hypothetical protein